MLRLGDMAAYAGRMSAALAILGFQLHLPHIVILAVVAIAASMTPLGRVGFREWGVAKAGALLGLSTLEAEGSLEQLALLDSAGEALVFLPLGAIALVWYGRRWRQARRQPQ